MKLRRAMSPKEKKMLDAYRKRYMEDKDLQTIADEIDRSYSTVRKYFSGDQGEQFRRYFSEKELQFLQIQLKQMAEDSIATSQDWISEGKSLAESSKDMARLAREERQTVLDAITMAEKLGLTDSGDTEKSDSDVVFNEELVEERLAEYYDEKDEQEVETE